jgi:hypothetical protein
VWETEWKGEEDQANCRSQQSVVDREQQESFVHEAEGLSISLANWETFCLN